MYKLIKIRWDKCNNLVNRKRRLRRLIKERREAVDWSLSLRVAIALKIIILYRYWVSNVFCVFFVNMETIVSIECKKSRLVCLWYDKGIQIKYEHECPIRGTRPNTLVSAHSQSLLAYSTYRIRKTASGLHETRIVTKI